MGYLISIISGVSYDKKDVAKNGIRILRGGNIQNLQVLTFDDDVFLPKSYMDKEKQVKINDILIVASTGSKTVIGKAGYVNNELVNVQIGAFLRIVRPLFSELAEYIKLIFATDYYREHIRTQAQGTNINNVKAEYITQLLVPIPPICEQYRIITEIKKFEPLVAEYDKLEQEKSKLDGEIYDKLKKSILQYAIQGKLVPQDENDEPASELLKRIRAEKKAQLGKKYVDSYIYKGDDNCYYEHIDGKCKDEAIEVPFELPNNWVWSRLINMCKEITDIDHNMPKTIEDGVPFLSAKDLLDDGTINYTNNIKHISDGDYQRLAKKSHPQIGDIIYSRIGACLGKARIVDRDIKFLVSYSCCTIKPLQIYTQYLRYVLDGVFVLRQAKKETQSIGVPDLGIAEIKKFKIPVPPIAEQKRIANKINDIFAKL